MENFKDFSETKNVTINPANIDYSNADFAGRDVIAHFERKPKRYKIRARKAFEQEIEEENKRVTVTTFIVGATVLATTVCTLAISNEDLELSQRIGSILLGIVSSKGLYDSVKTLSESITRKLNLENAYFDKYGKEYEEKRGRSLW